jgi:hypothetical protein
MKRHLAVLAFGIAGALGAGQAMASDTIVQFNRGIGVDPVGGINATTGLPTLNTVLGVPPGGRPWTIRKLHASVFVDGSISVRGSGLLFAGGDTIGTPLPITQVVATLFCAGTPFTSAPTNLDAAGNFSIRGFLGAVPDPCPQPVLLIRNAGGTQPWFAAGIVGSDDD